MKLQNYVSSIIVIVKKLKQPICVPIGDWLYKLWHSYAMLWYSYEAKTKQDKNH
jgi:hypothetical protein